MFQKWLGLRPAPMLVALQAQIPRTNALFIVLGESKAMQFMERTVNRLAHRAAAAAGLVARMDATSLLILFEQADQALGAACTLHEEMARWSQQPDECLRLNLDIGLSTGAVLCRPPVYEGDTILRASALATAATEGQILLDDELKALLSRDLARELQPAWPSVLGIPRRAWSHSCRRVSRQSSAPALWLHLQSPDGRARLTFTPDRPILIGRDARADYVVATPAASRQHAVITWHNGYYMLSDTSRHGTWVHHDRGGVLMRITHNVCLLEHTGGLSFGRGPDAREPADLLFAVKPAPAADDSDGFGAR